MHCLVKTRCTFSNDLFLCYTVIRMNPDRLKRVVLSLLFIFEKKKSNKQNKEEEDEACGV